MLSISHAYEGDATRNADEWDKRRKRDGPTIELVNDSQNITGMKYNVDKGLIKGNIYGK